MDDSWTTKGSLIIAAVTHIIEPHSQSLVGQIGLLFNAVITSVATLCQETACSWLFRPEIFAVGPQSRHLTMLALPALYVADLLEAYWLLGVKHFPAKFPDITYLVPKESLDEHLLDFPRRTQEDLLKVIGLSDSPTDIWTTVTCTLSESAG